MSWNQMTIRSRVLTLFACTLLVLILAFLSPIKSMFEAKKTCEVLEFKIENARNAPAEIASLKVKVEEWSKEMITDLDAESLQIMLFEEVGKIANFEHTQVRSIVTIGSKDDKDIRLQTFEVDLVGGYKPLLKVLHYLEQNLKYGKVASVGFFSKKVKGFEYEELHVNIIIQSATKL